MPTAASSYDHGACSVRLLGQTIGECFDRTVERWPEREALVVRHQAVRWTWRELRERVDALAAGLLALGLETGERIGIWAPNCAEWALTQFASAKAGLVLVNINPAYRRAELEYALNKVGCKALVLAPALKTSDYLAIVNDLAPELATAPPGGLHARALPHLRTVV
ncbi:MAG: AMP-binding protein, partial [Betaproteobacteria bacterium]